MGRDRHDCDAEVDALGSGARMYFPAGIPFLLVVALIVYNAVEEKRRSEAAPAKKPSEPR